MCVCEYDMSMMYVVWRYVFAWHQLQWKCKWFLNNVYFAGDILLKNEIQNKKNIDFESF
jgi:hypothetical protein